MKMKIIVLGTDNPEEFSEFNSVLLGTFSEQLENEESVMYFAALKDATVAVSKAFTEADTVLFLIKEERYGTDKRLLCRALGLSFETDPVIRAMALHFAGDEFAEDKAFDETHCRLPKGVKTFVLDDGLFAGFAAGKGTQTTIVLPMSTVRTAQLLEKQVIPYLNSSYNLTVSPENISKKDIAALAGSVSGTDITVAVSGTNSAKIFADYISGSPALTKAFHFTGYAEPRKNLPPNEYIVNLSITAAEFLGAPYGLAISNAFYSGDPAQDEKTVYIAVTNDAETVVRVVHSLPFEEVGDFMKRCCGEACRLLNETIAVDTGAIPRPEKKKKKKCTGLIAAVIITVIAIAGVVGYGVKTFSDNNYSLKKWYNTYFSKISNFTFEIGDESAQPGTSAENTERQSASSADGTGRQDAPSVES